LLVLGGVYWVELQRSPETSKEVFDLGLVGRGHTDVVLDVFRAYQCRKQ